MLGKRSRPVTGKLPDPSICFSETLTSPKSPLDIKIRSPRGLKTCNLGGGVGLGIVAALDKSRGSGSEAPAPAPVNIIVRNLNLIRSDPIPIELSADKSKTTTTNNNKCCRDGGEVVVEQPGEMMMGCNWDEFTTCVTSHGPNNKSFTTLLYFDDDDDGLVVKHKPDFGAVYPSPPPPKPVIQPFPTSNFLTSCYLCRKHLHGKDIYMYRGEKAFCSAERRYRQIVSDERKEKSRSEASRSVDISVSPYSGGHLFSTGIFAA